jgi:hypothetical protein
VPLTRTLSLSQNHLERLGDALTLLPNPTSCYPNATCDRNLNSTLSVALTVSKSFRENSVCEPSIAVFSLDTDPRKGDYDAAQTMYERALAINEKVLGNDHLSTATTLYGLANVLKRNIDDDIMPTVTLTLL